MRYLTILVWFLLFGLSGCLTAGCADDAPLWSDAEILPPGETGPAGLTMREMFQADEVLPDVRFMLERQGSKIVIFVRSEAGAGIACAMADVDTDGFVRHVSFAPAFSMMRTEAEPLGACTPLEDAGWHEWVHFATLTVIGDSYVRLVAPPDWQRSSIWGVGFAETVDYGKAVLRK